MRKPSSRGTLIAVAAIVITSSLAGGAHLAAATTPATNRPAPPPIHTDVRARIAAENAYLGPVSATAAHELVRTGSNERHQEQVRVAASTHGLSKLAPPTTMTWHQLGPTNARFEYNGSYYNAIDSGRLNTVRVSPTDPDTVYVGAADGGVWKTTNISSPTPTWTPIGDNLPALAVGSFDVDPSNPQRIVAGLGDFFDSVLAGGSVVQSSDGGATWGVPVALPGATTVRDLRIDPGNPSVVLVTANNGLWRSTDGGASFGPTTLPGLSTAAGWSLAYVGTTAAQSRWVASAMAETAAGTGDATHLGDLFLSSDSGATWTSLAISATFGGLGRMAVAAGGDLTHPASNVVYVEAANPGGSATARFLKSVDGGQSYSVLATNTTPITNPTSSSSGCQNMNVAAGQSFYNLAVAVDPTNPNDVLFGGQLCGVRTTDGGSTWTQVSNWLPSCCGGTAVGTLPYVHADWHAIAMAPLPGGGLRTITGTDGGVGVADDVFSNPVAEQIGWRDPNVGLATYTFYDLASGDPATGDTSLLYAGAQDNGTRLRDADPTQPAGTYNQVIGGDGVEQAITRTSGGSTVYWATLPGGVRYCFAATGHCDLGGSFTNPPLPNGIPFFARLSGVAGQANGEVLFNTSTDIWAAFASNPGGTPIRLTPAATFGSRVVRDVDASASTYSSPVAGTRLYGVALSTGGTAIGTDTGGAVSWTVSPTPLGVGPALSQQIQSTSGVAIPRSANDLGGSADGRTYLVASVSSIMADGSLVPASVGHLFRTTDGGTSWTPFHGNATGFDLPNVAIYAVRFDRSDASDQTIYAATELGLYRTTDGGQTWARYGVGLPNVAVRNFQIASDGSFVRAATYGRGLWEIGGDNGQQPSTTTLSLDQASVPAGVTAHVAATIVPSNAIGSVTFSDGGTPFATVPVAGGQAQASFSSSTVAIHRLTGVFIPSGSVAPSSGTIDVDVSNAALIAIGVVPATSTVATDAVQQYLASGTYSDNSTHEITSVVDWATGDATVATVGLHSGLVRGWNPGATPVSATIGAVSGSATLNVVAGQTVSIGDASIVEGDSGTRTIKFAVTLAHPATAAVTVRYSTADGTATAGADYTALTNKQLSFAAGTYEKYVSIKIASNTIKDGDRDFDVQLFSPVGMQIHRPNGQGVIIDDDAGGPPGVSIGDASVDEGDAQTRTVTLNVTLPTPAASSFALHYSTSDITAIAGSDYVAKSGKVSFSAGQFIKTIVIKIGANTTVDGDRNFAVILSSSTGSPIVRGTGTVTIFDDDGPGGSVIAPEDGEAPPPF